MLNGTTPEIQRPKSLFTETSMLLAIKMPNNFVFERFPQMIRFPKLFWKVEFQPIDFLVTL